MARNRTRQTLVRQWGLARVLANTARGRTVRELVDAVGASRATVFRDLGVLGEAGVPLAPEPVNGEVRYKILGTGLPALQPTPRQITALALLRVLAEPLKGTGLVRELDGLLGQMQREVKTSEVGASVIELARRRQSGSGEAKGPAGRARPESRGGLAAIDVAGAMDPAESGAQRTRAETVRAVDHAIEQGLQVELLYRGAKAERASKRTIDPVQWRLSGDQLYLLAFDRAKQAWRTFKAARIEAVQLGLEKAEKHAFDEKAVFGQSVRIWSGPVVDVAIRLSRDVARFAHEWPLTRDQSLEAEDGGTVVVRAKVAGTVEAARWVLGWGGEAEAVEPWELRIRVKRELKRALARY